MQESEIEKYFVKRVEAIGGMAPKWESPGNIGVPDRLAILPGGLVVFAEIKAPGKKLRPLQQRWADQLKARSHRAIVIDSKAKVNAFIEDYENGRI